MQAYNATSSIETGDSTSILLGSTSVPSTYAGRLNSDGIFTQSTQDTFYSVGEGRITDTESYVGDVQVSLISTTEKSEIEERIGEILADRRFSSLPNVADLAANEFIDPSQKLALIEGYYKPYIWQSERDVRRHRRAIKAEIIKKGANATWELAGDVVNEAYTAAKPVIKSLAEFSAIKAKKIGGQLAVLAIKGWEKASELSQRKVEAGLTLSKLIMQKKFSTTSSESVIKESAINSGIIYFLCAREISNAADLINVNQPNLTPRQLEAQVKKYIKADHPDLVTDPHFKIMIRGLRANPDLYIKAFRDKERLPGITRDVESSDEGVEFINKYGLKSGADEVENA